MTDEERSWDDLSEDAKARIEAADREDAVALEELVAQFDDERKPCGEYHPLPCGLDRACPVLTLEELDEVLADATGVTPEQIRASDSGSTEVTQNE